ncbi:uncharacterized protein N0V89_003539 [Didymosphaeria variabile]|uniref:BTB domain-containing protein n=1 Tax=Didymosphaeria variabile TaxID=1932322 RepID=A0A9W8XNQ3_9PLEO|nr:uncharacterized protein N0V89_003539 [Didymosphaeria variabile]KAJ4355522.1 hypothetical protein N0V89_003539 [Didymosphaeria variabile]
MSSGIMVAAAGQETKSGSKDFYAELLKTGMFSDLTLEVAGQKLKAHSVVLVAKSPLFAERIAKLKEVGKREGAFTILEVRSIDIVKNALSYCYTGSYAVPGSMPGDNRAETTSEVRLHAVIYMFSDCLKIAGLSEHSLKAFSTTATRHLQDPETKKACRGTIKAILSTGGSTLVDNPQFLETVSQLHGFDLFDESSTWGEIKNIVGYAATTADKISTLIDTKGKIHNFSSWNSNLPYSVMAGSVQRENWTPPKDFNKHLFRTGMFYDVTIEHGKGHVFKAHSTILSAKSSWFADRLVGRPFIDRIRVLGHHPSDVKLFGQLFSDTLCNCVVPENTAPCASWACFLELLQFCYTGEYVPVVVEDASKIFYQCTKHVYLYVLGKRYGIPDGLPPAVAFFAIDIDRVRKTSIDNAISLVNAVYESLGSDTDDALVAEARKIAMRMIDSMDVRVSDEDILKIKKGHIKDRMPKASADLFDRGYEPQFLATGNTFTSSTSQRRDSDACFRCRIATPVKDTRLCRQCTDMPVLVSNVTYAPKYHQKTGNFWGPPLAGTRHKFQAGMTCTFWACIGCDRIWQGQGLHQSEIEMKECPACDPEGKYTYPRDKNGVRRIYWKCHSCLTVWVAHDFERKKMSNMDSCV